MLFVIPWQRPGFVQKICRRKETAEDNRNVNRESARAPGVDEMVSAPLGCAGAASVNIED